MRNRLIQEFGSFHASVACTFDIWTGCNRVGYICVTGHYVDSSWEFQKRLLAFRQIPYPHDAQAIYHSVMSVFDLYGIKDKVISLTFDNASANTAAINLLKQTLRPPHGGRLFYQRCACHIINLVVQDRFKHFQTILRQRSRCCRLHSWFKPKDSRVCCRLRTLRFATEDIPNRCQYQVECHLLDAGCMPSLQGCYNCCIQLFIWQTW